jgi:hypothetical protein
MTYVDRNDDVTSTRVRVSINVTLFHVVQDSSLSTGKK